MVVEPAESVTKFPLSPRERAGVRGKEMLPTNYFLYFHAEFSMS